MTTGTPSARAACTNPEWPAGSLLGLLPASTRTALLGIGTAVEYASPRVIIREGEQSTYVVLLRSAVAKVIGRAGNGRESLLAIRVSGDIVGELGAIDSKPRSATVATCGPAQLNIIRSADFEGFLRRYPDAALALSRVIGERLRTASQHSVDLGCNSVRVRVAHVLDDLATGYGRPHEKGIVIDLDLTQKELGELVGAADTTVHKALRAMREDGLVETGYQQLIVRDIARLREVSELPGAKPYFYQNISPAWTDDRSQGRARLRLAPQPGYAEAGPCFLAAQSPKLQGRRLMPLMKLDSRRSGSPAAMSGTRVSSSRSITRISRRARWAPRQ